MKKDIVLQEINCKILKVEITEGPNYKQRNVEITVDKNNWSDIFPKIEKFCDCAEGEEFHFGINKFGIAHFGIWSVDPNLRPRHGGMWSSGAKVASELTGLSIAEIIIGIPDGGKYAGHMLVDNIRFLINSIGWDLKYGRYREDADEWYPVEFEDKDNNFTAEPIKKYSVNSDFERVYDATHSEVNEIDIISSNHNDVD